MNVFLSSHYGLDISQEAIAVQTNSKLGKRLEKMFTECFKMKDAKYTKDISDKDLLELTEKISKYISTELPKIAKEEIGINIVKMYCNDNHPNGDIMIDYATTFDYDVVMSRDMAMTGYSTNTTSIADYAKRIKVVLDIAKTYDISTGKVSKSFPVKIWFDTSMMLFLHHYYPVVDMFTVDECAAAVQHELGHISIFLERSPIAYYVAKTVDDNINKIVSRSNKTIDDHRVIVSDVLIPISKHLNEHPDKSIVSENNKLKVFVDKVATLVEFLTSKRDSTRVVYDKEYSDTGLKNNLNKPGMNVSVYVTEVLIKIISIILALLLKAFLVIVLYGIIKESIIELQLYTNDKKTSDIKQTQHNVYLQERASDEFVVRHGYGRSMATLLDKLNKIDSDYYLKDPIIRDSKFIGLLDRIIARIHNTNCGAGLYEETPQRIRRLAQATIGVLKDTNLPAEFKNKQLSDLKSILKVLDDNNIKLYKNQSFESVVKVLTTLISVDDWIRILTSGRLTQEYERQLNQIDDLINNSMYAHSADLKRLRESIK